MSGPPRQGYWARVWRDLRANRRASVGLGIVVVLKHILRNSLIPIVTILAGLLPALIGGSVIIETIFSIPGIGFLSFQAVLARDYPVVMALFAVSAGLTLVGILLADLALAVVDPRISFGGQTR